MMCPLESETVGSIAALKVIVPPAQASITACRSEPVPASKPLTTT